MAETYDGTEGDEALAAGMPVMDGDEDWRDGWKAINRTRDLIAELKTWVTSQISAIVMPVWSTLSGKPATFPPDAHTHSSLSTGPVSFGWNGGLNRWNTPESIGAAGIIVGGDANVGANVNVTGHVYTPNNTAGGAGTIAYVQSSDGRITRGVSARKYKKNIHAAGALGDIFPRLVEYQMRVAYDPSGRKMLGYIADDMIGTDAERFVVLDNNGEVDSIDVIQLLLAQSANLNDRLAAFEAASIADGDAV